MKKLVSLLLALAVILSFSMTTMAADLGSTGDPDTMPDDLNSALGDFSSTFSSGLTLNQSNVAVNVGETSQLMASQYGVSPIAANWTSSNTSIATVDSNGLVTGKSLGAATITATAGNGESISCPVHVIIRGIDVSRWQGNIDWNAVKSSGIDFAIIKATEGVDYVDPYFVSNMTGAAAAGLHIGAYHFLRAGDAKEQARQFIAAVKPYSPNYPLLCDVEAADLRALGKDAITDMVVTFCEAVRAAGYHPMIYFNLDWRLNCLDMSRLGAYDLWFARYSNAPGYNDVGIWQYSSTQSVPGISGNVDADYSYRNYPAMKPLKSDTETPVTFGTNTTYIYKITTNLTTAPKAVSSNPAAVSVAFYQKVSGGYLYKITNVNAGNALITTTASDGSSSSFLATGIAKGVICDTTAPFTMKKGATYQFKLTLIGGATGIPTIATGNSSVLKVTSTTHSGNSYYIKVTAGSDGTTSVYTTLPGQQPVRQCMVTVASGNTSVNTPAPGTATGVSSDTTLPFTMSAGKTYQFKFSLVGGTTGTPYISTGNNSVLSVTSTVRSGTSFYVKVTAKSSGCTSVYTTLAGQQAVRQCVITVA